MIIRILGSSAGGGFPQWNCHCYNCQGVRLGKINAKPRTQSSIAVSENGFDWVLINASPDIHKQIADNRDLPHSSTIRSSWIRAVILVDSQIDHTTGLLLLREGEPINLYCTQPVYHDLTTGFPILNVLDNYCKVNPHIIASTNEQSFNIPSFDRLAFTVIETDSIAPPYSEYRYSPKRDTNIGLLIRDKLTNYQFFYAPGLGAINEQIKTIMSASDLVLVDGTFWDDDEMIKSGICNKYAHDLGHLPQSGPNGMIELLDSMSKPRKILIHINNTNPILNEESQERKLLTLHHIEVAYDGMIIQF